MTTLEIATAMQRVESVLRRRPEAGLQDDPPAAAHWQGGARVHTRHPNGAQVVTDLATEMGGSGDQPSPGWLLRAALASCAATRIALAAAAEGIALSSLAAVAGSRSDLRGLLGMADANGTTVPATPKDVELRVSIAAPGVPADRLRALVEASCLCAPVSCAMASPVSVALRIDVIDAAAA